MAVTIEKVESNRALREFIRFPEKLYRQDPLWSPPIWMEERETFSVNNPLLAHSDFALFLARSEGEIAGRLLAYVDHKFNDFYNSNIGMFGSFESVRRPEVAKALFAESEGWLIARGMDTIRGPLNPVAECWGSLYEGFDSPATFMTPYNPPYYNEYLQDLGYRKVKDLLAFEGDARQGYQIPERFIRFRKKLLTRRPDIRIRRIDMKHLIRDAEAIWTISNQAIRDNWGWVPYDKEELQSTLKKLGPIADPDAIWILEDAGQPVGHCLGFPDINIILRQIRGRLFPFGFITLLRRRRNLQDFRLFGLAVLPEYHGQGLDVLLYMSLFEALAPRGVRVEASYILEDNLNMINAVLKLGLKKTKTYRVYEKGSKP
ncbi:MAG: GNAT family N-acetyltransferase [Spirochaetaceae bacterium]|nr:MAG: GNAT family N-acetyltransferase [Spirochaetaceae bacterium]